ncbi:MAG: phage tail sheath C-terminal domain-containing protein, partial [Chloroflexota bacterium]
QSGYVSAFDDSFAPDISDLLNQSTGSSSNTKVNYSAIADQFITVATSRLDHMFIPDALRYIFVNGANTKQSTTPGFVFSRDIFWGLSNLWGNIFTSYVALYGNWVKRNDVYSGQNVWLPFSGYAAQIMANVNQAHFPWTAPAGLSYGVINGVSDLAVNPIQKQRDLLYRIGINPICAFPNSGGYVIWGQKTALTAPSAFDRINVRRLFLYLEKSTQSVLKFFVFEPNNISTRARVVAALSPIYDQAVTNGGMYDYKIVCNENNNTASVIDQNQLIVSIYVQPTRTAEFILANFIAEPTGVNLAEFTA